MNPDIAIALLIGAACVFLPRLIGASIGGILQIATIVGLPIWALTTHNSWDATIIIFAGFAGLAVSMKMLGGYDTGKDPEEKK